MKRFPFYPLCVGVFALLSVYASNADQAAARDLLVPGLIILAATGALLGLGKLALRNVHRAAILVAAIVFCFMTFGRWVDALWAIRPDPMHRMLYQHAILIVQALLLGIIGYAVVRRLKNPKALTPSLNWFGCILLACPLLVIATQQVRGGGFHSTAVAASSTTAPSDRSLLIASLVRPADPPDIYFIVCDAHGRQDILRDEYEYDDGPFLQHLRDKGFYIADQSTSNYMWTELSIPSTLNMRYLDNLSGNDTSKGRQATGLVRNNALVAELKSIGYRTVALESMEPWLCLDNADVYYTASDRVGLTPLQQLILDSTALSQFGGKALENRLTLDQFHRKREITLYELAKMPQVAALVGPKFVFLHIYSPHTPFVFAADGTDPLARGYGSIFDGMNADVTEQQYHDWYREQAIYTDARVAQMVDQILARSARPPVIVLIGDHGPRSGMRPDPDASNLPECMSNLTAVLLPGKDAQGLYPQITPVNLFRVVLDDYFNAGLPMLPDKSYYSYPTPFHLYDVTAAVKPKIHSAIATQSHGSSR